MTNSRKELLSVAWRGMPKRRWFKREKYTARVVTYQGTKMVETAPKYWHAGVDIIQVRVPNPDPTKSFDRVNMHVRALCGYEYIFDMWLAATHFGNAMYKDEIKTASLRCPACERELAKEPKDRKANDWVTPPTQFHGAYSPLTEGGEPWWPSEK